MNNIERIVVISYICVFIILVVLGFYFGIPNFFHAIEVANEFWF